MMHKLLTGIRIVDAINILKQACGIFVKEVIAGSLAEMDGEYTWSFLVSPVWPRETRSF